MLSRSFCSQLDRAAILLSLRLDTLYSCYPMEWGTELKSRDSRPTILDVAKRAGVSVGTVSNVLNGAVAVSEERRQRVLQAIEDLSYTQNLLALGLRRHRAPVVGVCVPHTSVAYFAKLVDAFEDVASRRGFEIMQMLSHDDPRTEFHRISTLLNYRVGGIILVPSSRPSKALDAIAHSSTPLVVVDRPVAQGRFDQVTFDNRAAMDKAARSLIALGHRHILFLVRMRALATTKQRINALLAAARNTDDEVAVTIMECESYDHDTISVRIAKVLATAERPTAIIVSNSIFAACMIRTFQALGIRCPEEVSLLAFDQPDWADLVTPKLSVVRQPTAEVARRAWACLIRRMGDETATIQTVELDADIVFGASIGPPMGGPLRRPSPPRGQAQELTADLD
jgi:LacI family transcriptional regulator